MKYTYTSRNMTVSQHLKDITEKKLERLSKFFTPETDVFVTFKGEKRTQTVEVTIPTKRASIRCEATAEEAYTALDLVMDKLDRQIVKYRKKLISKAKQDHTLRQDYFTPEIEEEPESEITISRMKKIQVEPMDAQEAGLQMELSGHDFFAYQDGETGQICIIYRRNQEGTYGVLTIQD